MAQQISDRIREARTRNGWTQSQVEAWSDLPAGVVAQYEAGSRRPGADAIAKLALGLRVSADWLLGLDGSDCPKDSA